LTPGHGGDIKDKDSTLDDIIHRDTAKEDHLCPVVNY
jgi:hypothetical protein